ncbi:hypothetical protein [Pseudomonas fluorescens]|uniref:hypothetical protein n=1 Tax=Pseudomonas fluorescens TaxID=294 RepID=UPI00035F2D41
MSFLLTHLLSWSALLLVLDALLWHLAPYKHRAPRVGVRLVLFLAFSALVINADVSPLSEVGQALNKLQAVRQQNSRLALMAKPVPVRKAGFLGWLQKR